MGAAWPGILPSGHHQRGPRRARGAARHGSTGKNAGGVRHQFSHPANIELSIESIAMMANFEAVVGTPIDFHQDGYLFLLSKAANVATFLKNVAAAEIARRRRAVAVAGRGTGAVARPRRHRRQGRDLLRCRRRCRSQRRHGGLRKGRAGQGRGDHPRDRGHRHSPGTQPRRRSADLARQHRHAAGGQRRGPLGQVHWPHARRGRAGRARAPAYLHCFAAGRRIVGRAAQTPAACRRTSCW